MIERLVVNFGGPRNLDEIAPFLQELLLDRDVVWTKWPTWLHNAFSRRVAQKRSHRLREDYEMIGGRSPIFFDTEEIGKNLNALTFHRYLPATHAESLKAIENSSATEIRVFPLFPQFTYATTGSIARFFSTQLSSATQKKLRWIRSYPDHSCFVLPFQERIRTFLTTQQIPEEKAFLFFSAHGVPQSFIDQGDPYQKECERSYRAIQSAFPKAHSILAYQSKFGRGEWIRPYTVDVSETIRSFTDKSHIVFIPLAFPSDHIETLFEIEQQYMPLIREQGLTPYRCPALNLDPLWLEGIEQLCQEGPFVETEALIRR